MSKKVSCVTVVAIIEDETGHITAPRLSHAYSVSQVDNQTESEGLSTTGQLIPYPCCIFAVSVLCRASVPHSWEPKRVASRKASETRHRQPTPRAETAHALTVICWWWWWWWQQGVASLSCPAHLHVRAVHVGCCVSERLKSRMGPCMRSQLPSRTADTC